jgi:hypothetical protein
MKDYWWRNFFKSAWFVWLKFKFYQISESGPTMLWPDILCAYFVGPVHPWLSFPPPLMSTGQRGRPMVKAPDSGENLPALDDLAVELGENSTAADEHLGRPTVSDSLWLVGTNWRFHFFWFVRIRSRFGGRILVKFDRFIGQFSRF